MKYILLICCFWLLLPACDHPSPIDKTIIGATVEIDIPTLKLNNLRARVDTGAKTSSLDARSIVIDHVNDRVSFRPLGSDSEITLPLERIDTVKSSNGTTEVRAFVLLEVIICGKLVETAFSLRDRSNMTYRLLLGRSLLSGKFIVDVSR